MFDRIFDEGVDQNEIFSTLVNPLIEKAILGYNGTIFAYGQSGTGKTYTMGSDMKVIFICNIILLMCLLRMKLY